MVATIRLRSGASGPSLLTLLARMIVLLLPAGMLLVCSERATDSHTHLVLRLGVAFQGLVCVFTFFTRPAWRQPLGPSVVALYLIALGWIWVGAAGQKDWVIHLAQAFLLVVPLTVFALQTLLNAGATVMRQARLLADRLVQRSNWPEDLAAIRDLPEVKAFREAITRDATPALALLNNPKMPVRLAALAALEFRREWQPRQPELVLHVARTASEPAIRAAAITALANVHDRMLVEALAAFIRDPAWEVRKATIEALLWDSERRWGWVRHAIRDHLSDPAFKDDGPLRLDGQLLPPEAVADLSAWCAEKGILSVRAAQTLGAHFLRALRETSRDSLAAELTERLLDPHTAAPLRLELVRALLSTRRLPASVFEQLLSPANPAPLRLIAADHLLAGGEHRGAFQTLVEIARLPNREISLATAEVVQRRIGTDLGLIPDKPLPPLHSRQAADVTRRVMLWSQQQEEIRVPVPNQH